MRTKFTVIYEARYKYTCKDKNDNGEPYHKKDDLSFTSRYYYMGYRIDDCLKAFWSFICWHGYTKCRPSEKTWVRYIVIKEIKREEKPDDYSCGYCNYSGNGETVVTQITSDIVVHLWDPYAGKHHVIIYDEPRKIKDEYGYMKIHYGRDIENLRVGDIVDITCEMHSLMSGGCVFYNVTGKRDMELARKMHQYALHAETHGYNPYPGKFTQYCFNKIRSEFGIEPTVIDAFNCGYTE